MSKAVEVALRQSIAVITLNDSDNPVNTWTKAISEGMYDAIEELYGYIKEGKIKGVVLTSGKEGTFHTGANLNKMGKDSTRFEKMKSIEFNHAILNKISKMPVPVVAAINGHCMGGGFELALACTARIAVDGKQTLIGLPEMNMGLFPAGGGTQRLPRLIGYPAIDFILEAKVLPAKPALEAGIIDALCEAGELLDKAVALAGEIADGKGDLKRREFDFSDADEMMKQAREKALKKWKGRLLPAPKAMLEVAEIGLKKGLEAGLEAEKKHFIAVSLSPECKGMVHSFFLKSMTDKPQKMMTKGFVPKELKKSAVFGFGSMGRGIVINIIRDMEAPVVVKDTPEQLEAGLAFIRKTLTGMSEKGRLKEPVEDLMGRIITTSEFGPEFADMDIAIEAVYEDMQAKAELFDGICKVIPADCLLASNTSGLSINELTKHVTNPERFGGLHFFSPVWVMQLVEVVRGEKTTQETVDNFLNFSGLIRKRPLICRDSESFVVNAVLRPFIGSGLKCIEEGSPIEMVDKAMKDFGFPVSPLKLLDEVGIDVTYHIYKNRGEHQQTLENLFNAGFHGLKKSGKGLFRADGSVNPEAVALIDKKTPVERTAEDIPASLLREQVTIGKRLVDQKVVDDPKMIDLGMIYGTGYPQDKGGPLKWADLTGISEEMFGQKFYP